MGYRRGEPVELRVLLFKLMDQVFPLLSGPFAVGDIFKGFDCANYRSCLILDRSSSERQLGSMGPHVGEEIGCLKGALDILGRLHISRI